jgi:PPE-repeat protein
MDFALLPPELNSARMYSGPGSGPMLAAAAAWDVLAADLESTAASYQSMIAVLISGPWLGPSAASMAAAAMPYASWMDTTATQATQASAQAKMAAGAYEAAFGMTVPPPVIAANRSLLMALIATNLLGQNTAAIAATEAQYMEMWAQDAAAMYGYAGQSAAASMLTPFSPAPNTTNPVGLFSQAAAIAQTTATSAGAGSQTIVSTGPHLMSALPTALQGLAQPAQSAPALTGILDTLGFANLQQFLSLFGLITPYTASVATVNLSTGASSLNIAATHLADWPVAGAVSSAVGGELGSGAGALVPAGPAGLAGSAVTAGMGQGSLVGGMSVPPGWLAAAPEIRTVATALPITSATPAPALLTDTSGTLLSQLALAGLAGRAMGGTAGLGRRERAGAGTPVHVEPPQRAAGASMTGILAHLRELAELHDSEVLSDEEFNELKRRLLVH